MAPFVWATKDAYSKNEEKVLKGKLIEKLALEELEKPGGPASRGATQVICSTEHVSNSDRRNHVTVEFLKEDGTHVTKRHIPIPKEERPRAAPPEDSGLETVIPFTWIATGLPPQACTEESIPFIQFLSHWGCSYPL